jgi:hypothetical protein
MMLPAISIQAIDDELEKYPSRLAWEYLQDLNNNPVLGILDVWREHYPALLEKYRERLFDPIEQQKELTEAMKTVAERPTYSYGNGAIHDDHRNQFMLGEERANLLQQKQMTQ